MTSLNTTMDVPPDLPLPVPDAEPAPGCDVCAALVGQRTAARRNGDYSAATDANVEITRHGEHR